MKRIEFGELKIGEKARANLMDVCDTNWASGGPKVRELESKWSDLFDYKRASL
jgi:dTDP-4-amino-4,6-dideoxygalactose transaminase